MFCKECGRKIDKSYSGMCQTCYHYFKNGGTINPLPEPGRIQHDINGRVVCHICGRAYNRLGSHVKESHYMTIEAYKAKFGLCKRAKTTESLYSHMMSKYAKENKMDQQLIISGQATRIKLGQSDKRKGKQVCLQEILDKRDRKFKEV